MVTGRILIFLVSVQVVVPQSCRCRLSLPADAAVPPRLRTPPSIVSFDAADKATCTLPVHYQYSYCALYLYFTCTLPVLYLHITHTLCMCSTHNLVVHYLYSICTLPACHWYIASVSLPVYCFYFKISNHGY